MATNHSGFDSRCCFCVWSYGNIETAIRDNHKTVLHPLWEEAHFYVVVDASDQTEKRFSLCRVLWSVAAYPLGMLGYLVDTAIKIVLLIGNLLVFILSLLSCNKKWIKERGILLLDTAAAVGIGVIGIIIPPLAYKLDQLTQESMIQWATKSPSGPDFTTPNVRPPSGTTAPRRVPRVLFA